MLKWLVLGAFLLLQHTSLGAWKIGDLVLINKKLATKKL